MSSVPTVPSLESASGFLEAGPQGLAAGINLIFDKCNARPIWVYVAPGEGRIWRLFDPLSPTEQLPIWKEWSEEVTTKEPIWEWEELPPPQTPGQPTTPQSTRHIDLIRYVCDGATFKFDEPGRMHGVGAPGAFSDPSRPFTIQTDIDNHLSAPAQDGHPLPPEVTRKIVMFAHADMTNTFQYNHGLSDRRARSISSALSGSARARMISVGACADFNPEVGPNAHELAAERDARGVANNPGPGPLGNGPNRRVELLVIPDYQDASRSRITRVLNGIYDQLRPQILAKGLTVDEWQRGTFPCQHARTMCHKLVDPFDSPRDPAGVTLENRRHQNMDSGGNATASGPGYRQCAFYRMFKERIAEPMQFETTTTTEPPPEPAQPPPAPRRRRVFKGYRETTETIGEYHPPKGEHYGYYMDEMVKRGVNAGPQLAPRVDVAPNREENLLDFNLIKPGAVKVVKMDIGFWGDQRTADVSRKAGFRRTPARYFGLVEGRFVFLCYYETPEIAGFVRPCSDQFDPDLTPLSAALAQAARDAGHRILIMAKAVAEDGPDDNRLNVFFPDMHLPRQFDDRDPVYASDECIFRAQMVKSMVLHQLKRDYRLPAEQTPWLSVEDRRLCRDFFERGAPTLKLPHWSTGRRFSNPFEPEGEDFLSQAGDAAKKSFQAIMQTGYYMFSFTRDDFRRMVRRYTDDFPEKGYGRTKDILFNWFYGFTTDKNTPPPPREGFDEDLRDMIPGSVKDVSDARFGTNLNPSEGTPPAQESYDAVDPAPARDMLRFLHVIEDQIRNHRRNIQVFQTGDLYEIWADRRYLFEDFDFTDDPAGQIPGLATSLMPSEGGGGGDGFWDSAKQMATEALQTIGRNAVKVILGGINAHETDLWFRREANKRAPADPLPDEESWNVDNVGTDWNIPRFQKPAGSPGVQVDPQHNQLDTATVDYTNTRLTGLNADRERGKAYLADETRQRMQQVEALAAPVRDNAEDQRLLPRRFRSRNGDGLWNLAVIRKFKDLNATFIYGNHDCYRGVPLDGGAADAQPFHSEPGLWVEHGHRYEDSNIDGQPFGAFLTNLAFEIQEIALGEGLLDEFALHREQSTYQPGIMQWFLLTEFGLDTLADFQDPPDGVPAVNRFRISINSHTHVPDLVNAQIVFGERESTPMESIINLGGAAVKALLLIDKFIEWGEKWEARHGFDKWWEDIKGNTINWGADFAGLARCVDEGAEFARNSPVGKSVEALINEAKASGDSVAQTIQDNVP